MSHKLNMKMADSVFTHFVPPNSPPIKARLNPSTMKQQIEQIRKSMTEKAKFPGGVTYF